MTTTARPHILADLRHAGATIQRATLRRHVGDTELGDAHRTLNRHRHHTSGPLRHAIDQYLDDDTWRHGPLHLLAAVTNLTTQLELPNPHAPDIYEQLVLFHDNNEETP